MFIYFVNCISVKVSIIIPAFNTEKYLERCLLSVINQTLKEIEIICIDDNSTDNTLNIFKNFERQDNRIKVIHFEENKGVAAARNEGIKVATGEYIGFMDSDDYADEKYYENLYNNSYDYDVIVGKYVDGTNNSERYLKVNRRYIHGAIFDSIWKKRFILDNNVKHNINMKTGSDKRFRKDVYKFNPKVLQLPDEGIYYYYKRREGSLTNFDKNDLEKIEKIAKKREKNNKNNVFIKKEI